MSGCTQKNIQERQAWERTKRSAMVSLSYGVKCKRADAEVMLWNEKAPAL